MTGLRWSRRTTTTITQELVALRISLSPNTVARLLHQRRYSLRVNHKQISTSTSPDRNLQFEYLAELRDRFQRRHLPIVSVDSKKCAEIEGAIPPEHFVFPACEHRIDPNRPQKSFRMAWRRLTKAAGLPRFRFHDLRYQAITELAEAGTTDAILLAVALHMSRKMLEHYSRLRRAAKREALDKLESGLMGSSKGATGPGIHAAAGAVN